VAHQNRRGLRRVRSRVSRLADGPAGKPALPQAANDDLPRDVQVAGAGD
jgi:hypothetical protein